MDGSLPLPRFDHLVRMTDNRGLHEHATGDQPRLDLGYCTDDVARGLILTTLAGAPVPGLASGYLRFVLSAVTSDGLCHNRLSPAGRWTDEPGLGDWWGRAIWALGVVLRAGGDLPHTGTDLRHTGTVLQHTGTVLQHTGTDLPHPGAGQSEVGVRFDRLVARRSPFLRSMAYAALGAAAAERRPSATPLLRDAARVLSGRDVSRQWPWPEPRLHYDNAVLAHALIAAGEALDRPELVAKGLDRLEFLVQLQTHDGHLSVVPVGGRGPGERPPGYDQQPIEVASLATAGAAAYEVTGDDRWRRLVGAAAGWFVGDNDQGVAMFDVVTGAGYDGLLPTGRNLNRGAESTLAANLTLLQAHRLGVSACPPPSVTIPTRSYAPIRTA